VARVMVRMVKVEERVAARLATISILLRVAVGVRVVDLIISDSVQQTTDALIVVARITDQEIQRVLCCDRLLLLLLVLLLALLLLLRLLLLLHATCPQATPRHPP